MKEIKLRLASDRDASAIARLAALDDAPVPRGRALLGFLDGELAAAKPLERGATVANPFRRTAELVRLLDLWAEQEPIPRAPRARRPQRGAQRDR